MGNEKYCSQLENLPLSETDIFRSDRFRCRITGERCVAGTFEDPDGASPLSRGPMASYDDGRARSSCPAYSVPENLAIQLRFHRLGKI